MSLKTLKIFPSPKQLDMRVSPHYLHLHQQGDGLLFLGSYFCIEDVIKKLVSLGS